MTFNRLHCISEADFEWLLLITHNSDAMRIDLPIEKLRAIADELLHLRLETFSPADLDVAAVVRGLVEMRKEEEQKKSGAGA